MSKYRLGIALSGGGARGIAHLGVLDALHKHGIEPDVIAGASIGAIVGCLYAAGLEPKFILEEIKKERLSKFLSWSLPGDGFLDLDYMEELLSKHISTDDFSVLKKPFFVSVTNLNSGKNEILSEGKLFDYVIASSTIPVVFKTRLINNQMYVDGGLLNNMPALAIRELCDKVIGVHVNHSGPREKVSGIKQIVERCLRLALESNIKDNKVACDVFIQPDKVTEFDTFDFRKADQIYQTGFDYTEEKIPDILKDLERSDKSRNTEVENEKASDKQEPKSRKGTRVGKLFRNITKAFRQQK
jgi:NTE family protein